ncbi:phosphoglycerate kinase, partial [candidate division WWE3 bacterium CG10_big_fil_rev_8_21_14_0_10_48_23]
MKSVKAAKVSGKKVILRADLDLPLRQASSGQVVVSDDTRLRALLPTLKFLLENKAQVLIIGHLGRPKGKKDPKLSLEPVAEKLSELSNSEIKLIGSLEEAESFKKVVMLENLRFWPEE